MAPSCEPIAGPIGAATVLSLGVVLGTSGAVAVLIGLAAFWPLFVLLDRLYVGLVVEIDDGDEIVGPLGAFVGVTRTAVLTISLVAVPAALWVATAFPVLFVVHLLDDSSEALRIAAGVVVSVAELAVIGYGLTFIFERNAIRLMNSDSRYTRDWGTEPVVPGDGRARPDIAVVPAEVDAASSEIDSMEASAAVQRRSLERRRNIPVILSLLASWVWLAMSPAPSGWDAAAVAAGLGVVWGLGLLYGGHGVGARVGDRAPFRQIRLGASVLALLVLLPVSLYRLPHIVAHRRRSIVQWFLVTDPLQGASTVLRSGLLGWMALAVASPFVAIAVTGDTPTQAGIGAVVIVSVFLVSTVWLGRRAKQPDEIKLVLLRVFGSANRARFLFDVAAGWRGLGSVVCISAPDVSAHQMEPDVLVDVLFGMLRVRFALGEPHESETLARYGRPPALRRVAEIPASSDNWQHEMRYLLTQNSVALMDLRGFTADNRGCEFELGVLIDKYLWDATVVLVDTTTHMPALEQTLSQQWMSMAGSSPNMQRASDQLELVRIDTVDDAAVQAVVRRLCHAWLASTTYHKEQGEELLAAVVDSLQLLAADVDGQLARFPDNTARQVHLEALTFDPDLDTPSYLLSWGLIDEEQELSLARVTEASQQIDSELETVEAMTNHPSWHELRTAARVTLALLEQPRRTARSSDRDAARRRP